MKKIFSLFAAVLMAGSMMAQFDTWSVVGSKAIMNGTADWAIAETANDMATEDGVTYTLTVTGKTLEVGTTYEYKYAKGHAWAVSIPQNGNLSLTVAETAVYDIVYTVNVSDQTHSAVATKAGEAGEITHVYSIAGSSADLFGASWSETNTATEMTKGEDGIYSWTKENVELAAATIEYKVVVDHAWGEAYPSQNASLVIAEDAAYDVVFTFNPANKAVDATATKVGVEPGPGPEPTAANMSDTLTFCTTEGFDHIDIVTPGKSSTGGDYEFTKGGTTVTGTFGYIYNKKHTVYKSGTMVITAPADIDSVIITYNSSCYPFAEALAGGSTTTKTSAITTTTFIPDSETSELTFTNASAGKTELRELIIFYAKGAGPEPVITKDTTMYVAGNFTNWAEEMQALPYTITLPADSTITFKQVRVITTYTDEVETAKETTWFGQTSETAQMTRENNAWLLNGEYNVLLTTDAEGDYTFELNENGEFVVSFPELGPAPEPIIDTLYLVNSKGWGAPKIYFYGGTVGQITAWPGDAMVKVAGVQADGFDVYMFSITRGEQNYVIFNNGSGVQSGDLPISGNEGKYFNFADQTWYESAEAVACTWYLNANYNGTTEWRELTRGEGTFTRRDVYAPATNYYYNGMADDKLKSEIKGAKLTIDSELAAGDSAVFTLNPYAKTINITKIAVHIPEMSYDTAMFVAGNFTNWAEGMQALPYTINLPADSALEFKQVMQVITYADGVVTDTTLTWYGQANETAAMERGNSTWLLDGDFNVLLTTDAEGDYTFELNENGEFVVSFPEKTPTAIDYIETGKAVKIIRNGEVIILRDGKEFNVVGQEK